MKWDKTNIRLANGQIAEAQAPTIISASRSTDIPAFYSDWLVERLKVGYVNWKNPFNGVPMYVSFANTKLIVFWSKNPRPIIKHLNFFDELIRNYYFQFTLNDYDKEKLEPNVPSVQSRIDTFIELSEKIGRDKIIWRFDPLMLTDKIGVEELLKKVENIGNKLVNYTDKLVFSFADIMIYKKVQNNLLKNSIHYYEFNEQLMNEFASGLQQFNRNWNFQLATCAEHISLEKYGITHNKCIDDNLIIKLFKSDQSLMNFLGVKLVEPDIFNPNTQIKKLKDNKDKGQREYCGCIISKDIGEYNTCPHLCEYCYANTSKEVALANWRKHKENTSFEKIVKD